MNRIAPDINNPFPEWQGGGNNGGNNGQGGGRGPMMPAFQPGQLNALANQLNMGFGGGVKAWKQDMRNTYDPTSMRGFNFGGGGGGGNRGGNNDPRDPRNPGHNGNNGGGQGGFNPTSPRNHMAMPMGGGLLSAQMQQPQQQGLLGDIPPEVFAYLTSGMRR